jgi:hypothetical protein
MTRERIIIVVLSMWALAATYGCHENRVAADRHAETMQKLGDCCAR